MTATRLGLLGLTALVLIIGGLAVGGVVAHAAGAPAWAGRLCGMAVGFALSTLALRRGYDRG